MKPFLTTALGVATVVTAFAIVQPASARDDVGVRVGPSGFGVTIDDRYRSYCADDWYRRKYWDYCSRFYGSHRDDSGYYNDGDDYYYDESAGRYYKRHDRARERERDHDDYWYNRNGW